MFSTAFDRILLEELTASRSDGRNSQVRITPAPAVPGELAATEDSDKTPAVRRSLPEMVEELERKLIGQAYEEARHVKTVTARLLGIKTSTLYYKLEKYGFITSTTPSEPETEE